MKPRVKARCDGCKATMYCDADTMANRVIQKNGYPKFYCYKCCFKINQCKAAICPHCCDNSLCAGTFKKDFATWLDGIKGV